MMCDDFSDNQSVEFPQALPLTGHSPTSHLPDQPSDRLVIEAGDSSLRGGAIAAPSAEVSGDVTLAENVFVMDSGELGTEKQRIADNVTSPVWTHPVSGLPTEGDTAQTPPAQAAGMQQNEGMQSEGENRAVILAHDPLLTFSTFRPLWTITPHKSLSGGHTFADEGGVVVSTFTGAPPGWKHWVKEGVSISRDILLALVIALLIGLFVIQPVYVKGTSMLPRLREGERLFVNRFIYNFSKIERGDIVVFYYPKNPQESFIKRVIGLPGDEVTLSGGKLYINGKLVPETYLSSDYTTIISPPRTWIVEPHHYFVMGDNRDASNDSRNWGLVPEMYIYGKAVYRYWPVSEIGFIGDEATTLEPLRSPRRMEPQHELPPAE